jgi:hypothetical protein
MSMRRSILILSAVGFLVVGCTIIDPVPPTPSVVFKLDAPLCSSKLPVVFSIDNVQIGQDTFTVNLAPNHTTSKVFGTAPGSHTIGARVVNGYVWTDTTVTLTGTQEFTRNLPFYCS